MGAIHIALTGCGAQSLASLSLRRACPSLISPQPVHSAPLARPPRKTDRSDHEQREYHAQ